MTAILKAKAYLNEQFEHVSEIRSYMQDVTDDGVFTKADVSKFDDETIIAIVDDLRDQFRQQFGHLFN